MSLLPGSIERHSFCRVLERVEALTKQHSCLRSKNWSRVNLTESTSVALPFLSVPFKSSSILWTTYLILIDFKHIWITQFGLSMFTVLPVRQLEISEQASDVFALSLLLACRYNLNMNPNTYLSQPLALKIGCSRKTCWCLKKSGCFARRSINSYLSEGPSFAVHIQGYQFIFYVEEDKPYRAIERLSK